MGTMQPIRSKENIEALKEFFLKKKEIRNYTMVVVGLNVPLRICDILSLKWSDVYDVYHKQFRSHLKILEKKTRKQNYLALNSNVVEALRLLMQSQNISDFDQHIFATRHRAKKPLSRVSAYLIIHNAAESIGIQDIGCHSLRKTFGYHAWKQGVHLALIMSIYNHSSINITKRYLGIEQEDKDNVLWNMNL